MSETGPRRRGVVFDMDGLLLDTERVYFEAFRAAHRSLGLPQNDDLFLRMVGTNSALSNRTLEEGLTGRVSLAAFNRVWDTDIAERLAGGIPAKPGAAAIARALRAAGLPYIIATSTRTEKAHEHLTSAGLGELFPDIVGGDQVARSKPAPDIYLRAAERLGLPPADLVALEDSTNGVRAALAAGLVTIQVPDLVQPDAEQRAWGQHVLPDLFAAATFIGLGRIGADAA